MTNQNSESQNFSTDNSSAQVQQSQQSTQSYSAPVDVVSSNTSENMLPQSHVNKIVSEAYKRAYEKGRNEGSSNNFSENQQSFGQQNSVQANNTQVSLSVEDTRRIAAQEAQRVNDENAQKKYDQNLYDKGKSVLDSLLSKFSEAKEKYNDFDEKVVPFFNEKNAPVFGLIESFDNAADIAYEVSDRPGALRDIKDALELGNQKSAVDKIKLLSDSIKINQQSLKMRLPHEPLSQIKASPTNMNAHSNGSNLSVDEIRRYLAGL